MHATEYDRALQQTSNDGPVELVLPARAGDRTHIANQYTVRVRRGTNWSRVESPRDCLRQELDAHGIASAVYYPVPLHRQECFERFGPYPSLPVAEALADEVWSLPVFPALTEEEQSAVVSAVRDFLSAGVRK
jgi:dTDP-4-amino-4,6-dideoxygalactose transaminase